MLAVAAQRLAEDVPDLPGETPEDDEYGFEDQGEGEAAESTQVDFRSAIGVKARDAAGWIDDRFRQAIKYIDGRIKSTCGHKRSLVVKVSTGTGLSISRCDEARGRVPKGDSVWCDVKNGKARILMNPGLFLLETLSGNRSLGDRQCIGRRMTLPGTGAIGQRMEADAEPGAVVNRGLGRR